MHLQRLLAVFLLLLPLPGVSADEPFDYQLFDMDGRLYKVSDNRGKWLIINFWATWCTPCLKEMPELERFYQQSKTLAQVWGVSFEDSDKAAIKDYVERLGITFPILGYGQDPMTGYGAVNVLPTTFIIDPDGLFHHRFEGPITADDIVSEISRTR
ncbi:MAG: TlpA family protein disulfide reductase [Gammaproteobacteria bacterium]|nr:TlpA family protein disulfide reductase [Gammaproteobacteria bacterium]